MAYERVKPTYFPLGEDRMMAREGGREGDSKMGGSG